MAKTYYRTLLVKGTSTEFEASTSKFPPNALLYETDTRKAKFGDGVSLYPSLPYIKME
jgi:hypothetical protein